MAANRPRTAHEGTQPRSGPSRWSLAPPWLLSVIAHLLVVAAIGEVLATGAPVRPIARTDGIRLDVVAAPGGGEEADAGSPDVAASVGTAAPVASQPTPPVTPAATSAIGGSGTKHALVTDDPAAPAPARADQAVADALRALETSGRTRAGHLGARTAEGRRAAVGRYGGSGATESAVERGLAWLARHQDADGKWNSDEYWLCCPGEPCCGPGEPKGFAAHDLPLTALALLAMLGAGHTPEAGTHRDPARRAVAYLLASQRADGAFAEPGPWPAKFHYHQALAVFALAECLAQTRDARLREPVMRGVRLLEGAQEEGGGWNYRPGLAPRLDSSVTGWVVLALLAARSAGVPVADRSFAGSIRHVRALTRPDGRLAYSDDPGKDEASSAMASVGLLLRLALGQPPDAPEVRAAARILATDPPDRTRWHERDQCLYYWYHGSLAAFLLGGEAFAAWNGHLVPELLAAQARGGHADGCWLAESLWSRQGGGRVFATALGVMCLEVYYRYVPEAVLERGRPFARSWGASQGEDGR